MASYLESTYCNAALALADAVSCRRRAGISVGAPVYRCLAVSCELGSSFTPAVVRAPRACTGAVDVPVSAPHRHARKARLGQSRCCCCCCCCCCSVQERQDHLAFGLASTAYRAADVPLASASAGGHMWQPQSATPLPLPLPPPTSQLIGPGSATAQPSWQSAAAASPVRRLQQQHAPAAVSAPPRWVLMMALHVCALRHKKQHPHFQRLPVVGV